MQYQRLVVAQAVQQPAGCRDAVGEGESVAIPDVSRALAVVFTTTGKGGSLVCRRGKGPRRGLLALCRVVAFHTQVCGFVAAVHGARGQVKRWYRLGYPLERVRRDHGEGTVVGVAQELFNGAHPRDGVEVADIGAHYIFSRQSVANTERGVCIMNESRDHAPASLYMHLSS